jgi:gliding motility-associated lipoprotein GldD
MESRFGHLLFMVVVLAGGLWLPSCAPDPVPKPVGYFRIELPRAEYKLRDDLLCPFAFEASTLSRLEFYTGKGGANQCWFDVAYPALHARVHITYKPVEDNLRAFIEESRSLAYEHQIKASRIANHVLAFPERDVYGLAYELDGNVASYFQFYLTDSTHHFLRGSLYFESRPNSDSLQPVLRYVKDDLWHFVETFRWKEQ